MILVGKAANPEGGLPMAQSDEVDKKVRRFWLQVFNDSQVEAAACEDDPSPGQSWSWPTETYLQRRLKQLRSHPVDKPVVLVQNDNSAQGSANSEIQEAASQQSEGANGGGHLARPKSSLT